MALEIASERMTAPLFQTSKHAWKRSRHWFMPAHHSLLKSCRLRLGLGSVPELLMHGSLLQSPKMSFLKEVAFNGKIVLPAGAALEVLF